jgi:hypothetical protein
MMESSDNSTTLTCNYTMILKDDSDRKSALPKRKCVRSNTAREDFQRIVDQFEEFDDDLIDSLHLTRERLKVRQSHRLIENRNDIVDLEKVMIQDKTVPDKQVDYLKDSEQELEFPFMTRIAQEWKPDQAKAA